jgi:hypothetical protein
MENRPTGTQKRGKKHKNYTKRSLETCASLVYDGEELRNMRFTCV